MSRFSIETKKALRRKPAKIIKARVICTDGVSEQSEECEIDGFVLNYRENPKAYADKSKKAFLLRAINACINAGYTYLDELEKIDPALAASFYEEE